MDYHLITLPDKKRRTLPLNSDGRKRGSKRRGEEWLIVGLIGVRGTNTDFWHLAKEHLFEKVAGIIRRWAASRWKWAVAVSKEGIANNAEQ
ncbi:MAG: hypothetical protein ABSA33_04890 [Candidatus Micrarchaeaceae archaeon]